MSYTVWRRYPNRADSEFASCPKREMALRLRDRLRATAKADGKLADYFVTHPDIVGPIEWKPVERSVLVSQKDQ